MKARLLFTSLTGVAASAPSPQSTLAVALTAKQRGSPGAAADPHHSKAMIELCPNHAGQNPVFRLKLIYFLIYYNLEWGSIKSIEVRRLKAAVQYLLCVSIFFLIK